MLRPGRPAFGRKPRRSRSSYSQESGWTSDATPAGLFCLAHGARSPAERLAQVLQATPQGLLCRGVNRTAVEPSAVDRLRDLAAILAARRYRHQAVVGRAVEQHEPRPAIAGPPDFAAMFAQPLWRGYCHRA